MKLNPTDGYVISPYIIWGELDYRGCVALGLAAAEDFKDLSFLKEIKSACQYIRRENRDYLFISFPLSSFCPKTTVFNLTDKKLAKFYKTTYENAQDEILKTFYQVRDLCGQELDVLQAQSLGKLWQNHFNPLTNLIDLDDFDATDSILHNCLPTYKVYESSIGFELSVCIHHYILVQSFSSYKELITSLKDFCVSVKITEEGKEVLIHLYAADIESIRQEASKVKATLHTLPNTDYYEANELGENVSFFQHSIPGWCYGKETSLVRMGMS